jgi:phosphopantetheine--protein transferase-like protein
LFSGKDRTIILDRERKLVQAKHWPPQVGIGIDIEDVNRFREEMKLSTGLLSRAFTKREIAYCLSKADPSMHFAGTFAAKEAALKSLDTHGPGASNATELEVLRTRNGGPDVTYRGEKEALRRVILKVSISHTTQTAVAVAVSIRP